MSQMKVCTSIAGCSVVCIYGGNSTLRDEGVEGLTPTLSIALPQLQHSAHTNFEGMTSTTKSVEKKNKTMKIIIIITIKKVYNV